MGGYQHRRPLIVDVTQQAQEFGCEIGIEVASGFVGEYQSRLIGECASNRDSLLLTSRECIRECPLPVLKAETPEYFDGVAMGLARGDSVDAENKGDVFEHGLASQELEVLKDDPDLAA
jgi:hypothetical protein